MLIPREIHYIWMGKKPMHPLMVSWRQEWQRLHQDWKIRVWTEGRNIAELVCDNENMFSRFANMLFRCCHLSQASNIWRYDLLERIGGLYLDTDFEPVKNIEPIVSDLLAFAGMADIDLTVRMETTAACSLIGCTPHHPWLRDLVENIKSRDPAEHRSLGFPYFNMVTQRHPEVHLFDPVVFYSSLWSHPGKYKEPIPARAYAVHRWSGKWFPQGFEKLSTRTS